MFNKITLIGRLGRDPEAKTTPAGTVADFSLATDETWQDNQGQKQTHTEWHRIVVWGKQAELCTKYLAKGRLAFVEGRLQMRKYQDSQGQERVATEVKAQRVLFLDRPQSPEGFEQAPQDPGLDRPTEDDLPF